MNLGKFRERIGQRIQEVKDGVIRLNLGDSLGHAKMVGQISGLTIALEILEQMDKADDERDG